MSATAAVQSVACPVSIVFYWYSFLTSLISLFRYDPTIESTHHKTIRFRKVHFATDIVDTAGMVCSESSNLYTCNRPVVSYTRFLIYCTTFQSQDEYSRLSRNASLGVHGYALVFSIVSRQSFEMIQQVNDALLNTLGDAPDVPRVLVGSMKDLEDQRQVSLQVRL